MTKQVGYIGQDQYGHYYHIDKHPRKELLKQLGRSKAQKMYVDTASGKAREKGYVIGGLWISVYRVHLWKD